jgi:hypothetical protein
MSYLDQYRDLPAWRLGLYCVLIAAAIALIVIDLAWKDAQYTTIALLIVIALMVALRPGGWRGPRSGA